MAEDIGAAAARSFEGGGGAARGGGIGGLSFILSFIQSLFLLPYFLISFVSSLRRIRLGELTALGSCSHNLPKMPRLCVCTPNAPLTLASVSALSER